MSCSFAEFDLRYVQHQFLRALALCAQESAEPGFRSELRLRRQQPCLRGKSNGADFGLYLALASGFFLLRLVPDLEFDCRNARGGVAQRAQLYQVPFNLY
jgi:hypothetical protein